MIGLGLYLRAGAVAAGLAAAIYGYHAIKDMGRQEERLERAATIQRKLDNATIADDANTRCLADPACRLSDDGFRRD